jgi:hypothetical protein
MKTNQSRMRGPFPLVLLAALALLAGTLPVFAANQAADDASTPVYFPGEGWNTGNGGYGFGPWIVLDEATEGGAAGNFVATAAGNIYLNEIQTGPNGQAWAMYANNAGGPEYFQQVAAFRGFTDGPLLTGQSFTIRLEHGSVDPGGTLGFTLRTGNATASANDYNTGARFEFGFLGGQSYYFIVDGDSGGGLFYTPLTWTPNGMEVTVTLLTPDRYHLKIVNLLPPRTTNIFTRNLAGTGGIQSFALYARDVDAVGEEGNVYFNSAAVSAEPPSAARLWPLGWTAAGAAQRAAGPARVDFHMSPMGGTPRGPQETKIRMGYSGQLQDLKGLKCSASAPEIDEEAPVQFEARDQYDDKSTSPLPGLPLWSPSGPIDSIDENGVAQTKNVYQDTRATAVAHYAGRQGEVEVVVRNKTKDDFGPYSNDGVDDLWTVGHFGEDNPDGMAGEDPDDDGQDNKFEFYAGLDPRDQMSHFSMTAQKTPPPPGPGRLDAVGGFTAYDLIISPVFPDRTYIPVATTHFTGLNLPVPLVGYLQSDDGDTRTFTDTNAVEEIKAYGVTIQYDWDE